MKLASPDVPPEKDARQERHQRIRRAKRFLRPLPRRATIHRYPVLKFFAQTARKRPYLWSFREQHVSSAIYVGCILAFLPAYGFQIVLAFFCALLFRSNLLITTGLQFITNPVTIAPIYLFTHRVGVYVINNWGLDMLPMPNQIMGNGYALTIGGILVGLFSGLVLDLVFRIGISRTRKRKMNLKRMLKNER